MEDRYHIFFSCPASKDVWERLGMSTISNLADDEIWNANTPPGFAKLWPFVLLTILSRLWDARNGEVFRNETASSRTIITRVCDDFAIWRKHLKQDHDVNSLNDWRSYLLSCNSITQSSWLVRTLLFINTIWWGSSPPVSLPKKKMQFLSDLGVFVLPSPCNIRDGE